MGRAFWQEKKEPNEIPWLEIRQVHELTEEFELYKKNGRKRKTKSQNTKHISQKKKKTLMIF